MKSYSIKVVGEAESDFRGARPAETDALIKKPDKNTSDLIYRAVKAQVELNLQAGDVKGAWEAIKKYQDSEFEYANPLNCFQRDNQNGKKPYIGAHAVFGAFRDAAKFLYPTHFYQNKKGQTQKPSAKHFRKFVQVRPIHIFLHRPDLSNGTIDTVDEIQGQQPIGEVRGFARYEAIFAPFQFQFQLSINPKGPFEKLLSKKSTVEELIHQATLHGLGGGRAAGFGQWKVIALS